MAVMLSARRPATLGPGLGRLLRHPAVRRTAGSLLAIALLGRLLYAPLQALHGAGSDYVSFATGARILASGSRCLYCLSTQADAQAQVLGYRPAASATGFPHIFANPPLAAWLLRPVASLPLSTGLAVFLVASLAALLAAARLLERRLPRTLPEGWRTLLVVAAAASLPAAMTLLLGQWDAFLLLAATGALWAMDRERPLTAGLLLSILLVKPQLGWLLLPVLAAASRWRIAAGFALGATVWVGSGLLIVGPRQLVELLPLVRARQSGESLVTAGLPALAGPIGGTTAVLVAAPVLAAAAVALAWRCRAGLRGAAPTVVVSLGICASILCAPHVFSDDLLLLVVPLVVLATTWPRAALAGAVALSAGFALDEWVANIGPRWAEAMVALAVGTCLVRAAGLARAAGTGTVSAG
jgi:Glycosyltransferase family 87